MFLDLSHLSNWFVRLIRRANVTTFYLDCRCLNPDLRSCCVSQALANTLEILDEPWHTDLFVIHIDAVD